jgi:hypothetical protein
MITVKPIDYQAAPCGRIAIIPAGTKVREATNLRRDDGKKQYWAEAWEGMDERAGCWLRNYGFLLDQDDVDGTSAVCR